MKRACHFLRPGSIVALTLLCASVAADPVSLTINVASEISTAEFTGTAPLPLARDPANALGDSIDGYGFVDSRVDVSESAAHVSSGNVSVAIASDGLLDTTWEVSLNGDFHFFFDLAISDVDDRPGRDFAPGLVDPLLLMASGATPVSINLSGALLFDATDLDNIVVTDLGTVVTATTVVHPLGVDVNGNGELDTLKYTAESLEFDVEDLILDDIAFDSVDILPWLLGIADATVDVTGLLAISSASMTFTGGVQDESLDPPFAIELVGSINGGVKVPEPLTLVLLLTGLLAATACRRRVDLR